MTNAAPAELAAVTARINEIRARIGTSTSRSGASVTAGGTAFARTLSQALGSSASETSLGTASTGTSGTTGAGTSGTSALRLGTTSTDAAGGVPVTGDRAVALAAEYTGTPYRWGGTDPSSGLDCSGLTQLVFRRLGVELPRTSAQQARTGTAVESLTQARPGDLVFFGSPVHHVGIYAGGGKMIDAPRAGKDVGLHTVWSDVTAIRRVVPGTSATTAGGAVTGGSAAAAGQIRTMLASMQSDALQSALSSLDPASDSSGTGTGGGLSGLGSAGTAGSTTATATVNQLLAAARGFGTAAPGGVMGGAGAHEVSLDASLLSALGGVQGLGALGGLTGAARTSGAGAASAVGTATGPTGATGWRAQPYADLFAAAGEKYGVDPALLSAIAKAESAYRPSARSHAGAVGLMQIMPGTARGLGVDPSDPAQAVDGAARLVSRYLKTYGGDVDRVLAAYNAGPGAVKRYGGVPPYAETRTYVQRVTGFWKDLS